MRMCVECVRVCTPSQDCVGSSQFLMNKHRVGYVLDVSREGSFKEEDFLVSLRGVFETGSHDGAEDRVGLGECLAPRAGARAGAGAGAGVEAGAGAPGAHPAVWCIEVGSQPLLGSHMMYRLPQASVSALIVPVALPSSKYRQDCRCPMLDLHAQGVQLAKLFRLLVEWRDDQRLSSFSLSRAGLEAVLGQGPGLGCSTAAPQV